MVILSPFNVGIQLEWHAFFYVYKKTIMDKDNQNSRPGQANTNAVQPTPEAERHPNYQYEEQQQGTSDEETLKEQNDRGLRKEIHDPSVDKKD